MEFFYWGYIASSAALGDIDGDSRLEVCIGSSGNLYCLNGEDGSLLWSVSVTIDSSSPVIGHIDGDRKLEICIGVSRSNYSYCFNGEDGSISLKLKLTSIFSTPAMGDVNGNGYIEICMGSRDFNLYCFQGGPMPSLDLLPWSKFRYDLQNAGFFGSTAPKFAPFLPLATHGFIQISR